MSEGSDLWDITKAETTLGNAQNAGRRMSGWRARSSLRAMLRLAKEGRLANNRLATRAPYSEAEQIFHPCATPSHGPSANTKSPLATATKDLLSDLFCGSRQNLDTEQSEEPLPRPQAPRRPHGWRMDSTTEITRKGRIDSFRARLLFLARLVCHQL